MTYPHRIEVPIYELTTHVTGYNKLSVNGSTICRIVLGYNRIKVVITYKCKVNIISTVLKLLITPIETYIRVFLRQYNKPSFNVQLVIKSPYINRYDVPGNTRMHTVIKLTQNQLIRVHYLII